MTDLPAQRMPAEVTSFVGRRNDVASIRQIFAGSRLVTLTGIGGVGKTRLAMRAAGEMRRAFADDVCFLSLTSLTSPEFLAQAVMDALGIEDRPLLGTADSQLLDYLSDRQMLIVLDSCEHLVEGAAQLVDQILRSAPDVKILATSQQSLRTPGESVYPVAPLLSPDPAGRLSSLDVAHYPSVILFVDRASSIVPGFSLNADNAASVVRLCHRLEGIPLAIELAAVQLRLHSIQDLADRLDDRFVVLRTGNRNVPQRHQTLRALIDWSHDLCTPSERALWATASVFVGGFSLSAAEAVCADEGLPPAEVADAIGGLVDKSIVVRAERNGFVRFEMLDTIRDYAQRHLLDDADRSMLARRHRDWVAGLANQASREWTGAHQEEWATRFQVEYANVRLAVDHCMSDPGSIAVGVGIVAQHWFWGAMDHLNEAQLWLDRALDLMTEPSHEHAWALATRGYIAAFQGDDAAMNELPERAVAMAIELGDQAALALGKHAIGFRLSLSHVTLRDAVSHFEEARRLYRESGFVGPHQDSVNIEQAVAHVALQEFDRASAIADDVLARCEAAGERWNASYALWVRALIAVLARDDAQAAEVDLLKSLDIKRAFSDTIGFALTLEVLVWTGIDGDDPTRAAVLMGSVDRIWRVIGSRLLVGRRRPFEARARDLLGDQAFEAARRRGASMGMDEVIRFALGESEGEPKNVHEPDPLTRREREVSALVARGMSNKEIAAELVISLRTAEGHVERILSKLGFRTRSQVAVWVTERRPQP